jgi:hypothetical protein
MTTILLDLRLLTKGHQPAHGVDNACPALFLLALLIGGSGGALSGPQVNLGYALPYPMHHRE